MRMDLPALTPLLVTLRLSGVAQGTPMEAFRGNIAAIHARDRAAYLSHYLHTPELARVGPDGLRLGYDEFARGAGEGWPDTLVATHLRIVAVSPDVPYGGYRHPALDPTRTPPGRRAPRLARRPARAVRVGPGGGRPARTPGAVFRLLPVQRRHLGVRRRGVSVDARPPGACRAQHYRAPGAVRRPGPFDDRLLAQRARPAPVHL